MKASEVKLGGYYMANVSGKRVPVQVLNQAANGKGYDCKNLSTGRVITTRSAARLLKEVSKELAEKLLASRL